MNEPTQGRRPESREDGAMVLTSGEGLDPAFREPVPEDGHGPHAPLVRILCAKMPAQSANGDPPQGPT